MAPLITPEYIKEKNKNKLYLQKGRNHVRSNCYRRQQRGYFTLCYLKLQNGIDFKTPKEGNTKESYRTAKGQDKKDYEETKTQERLSG
jgi:hypothetical protein